MSAVSIGVAWMAMAMAAFAALSSGALARTRSELEGEGGGLDAQACRPSEAFPHARQATAQLQWPELAATPPGAALRRSPSVAYVHTHPRTPALEPVLQS